MALAPRAAGEIQISALPEATTPINENDLTNIKQGVEDRKVRVADLLAPHASRTGNVHNLTPADINLGQVMNYPITDAVNDKSSNKYASAMAVALVSERIDRLFPVGHVMLSLNAANPSTYGYVGTWELRAKGRTLVGHDPANAQRPVGSEFGSSSVTLGMSNLPAFTVRVTGAVSSGGGHVHAVNLGTTGAGSHSHTSTGNTNGSGNHNHSFNVNASWGGNHAHSFSGNTSQIGNHNHGAPVESDWNDYAGNNVPASYWSGGRRVFYNARTSTSWDGAHSHSFSGGTSGAGDHTHNVSGNTSTENAHVHSFSVSTNTVDNHTHNVSGNTATAGDHTHNIDLTSQSMGGGQAFDISPLALVTYIWVRTA